MKKKLIEFKNFGFKYDSQQNYTLKNINLDIYEGEKVLILGESGCGKSTLCNSINGLVPFFYSGIIEGSLKINGENTKDMSIFEISKIVGTVLQDPDNQFIALTSAEDIAFKLENLCVNKETMYKKVLEVSKLIGMDNFLNSNPHNLSGGQKQKVTLGGAIVDEIDILLFDEPLASLDPKTSENTIELINTITHKTNKTMIIIEHRLEEILKLNLDKIVLLSDGEIIFSGAPNDLLKSDLLKKCGIREPLYLTALKYAGIEISRVLDLENLNNIDKNLIQPSLNKFYNSLNYECEDKLNKTPIFECKNITFSYNNSKKILEDVSFKVFENELLCIVGKNGAGKSTISKLMCGFMKNNSGSFIFNGKDITNYTIYQRSNIIGYVMQNPNQMISHTIVFDEISFALKNLNLNSNEIKEKVNEILKICDLYEMRNWPISALSFGQKRRVTIASILVMNPKILILDEPTAAQDFKHYTQIMEFIKSLTNHGITSIMITHDMHLLLEYADRCIVISDGKKIGDDIPSKILSNEEIIEKANLKQTSLHELSIKCNINSTEDFINKFITYDRSIRNK